MQPSTIYALRVSALRALSSLRNGCYTPSELELLSNIRRNALRFGWPDITRHIDSLFFSKPDAGTLLSGATRNASTSRTLFNSLFKE